MHTYQGADVIEILRPRLVGVVRVHQAQAGHVVTGLADGLHRRDPRIRVHDHRHHLGREEGPAHDRNDVQRGRQDLARHHQLGAGAGLGLLDDFRFDSVVVFHSWPVRLLRKGACAGRGAGTCIGPGAGVYTQA